MALDPIWKQQFTLVTYGNEFLNQELSLNDWIEHSIFSGHNFHFRNLISQHLLAQHFHIWLVSLKNQGVKRLSLHNSSTLNDEANPNPNVELLPYPHFIVSHSPEKKSAWLFGKELPEWYQSDEDYQPPLSQKNTIRQEVFWCFKLNHKLAQRLEEDFETPNWDDIDVYLKNMIFQNKYTLECPIAPNLNLPYTGFDQQTQTENPQELTTKNNQSLLPTKYQANFAHYMLYKLDYLNQFIQQKIQHPYELDGKIMMPETQAEIRFFSEQVDELTARFITKVANHYQTAYLTPNTITEKSHEQQTDTLENSNSKKNTSHQNEKPSKMTNVFTLIIITILICILAYHFGL